MLAVPRHQNDDTLAHNPLRCATCLDAGVIGPERLTVPQALARRALSIAREVTWDTHGPVDNVVELAEYR
jgi:hypothetical protein